MDARRWAQTLAFKMNGATVDSFITSFRRKAARERGAHESSMHHVISAQIPNHGAVAATYAFAPFIDVPKLNQATHELLSASPFSAVYLHLLFSRLVYAWTPTETWHVHASNQ